MKKIFYSMMAVALCACSQSDVDDNVVAPQPENNGLKFTVVDNGFVGEDGTRVTYDGITASFGENDEIGIFAIKTSGNMEDDHADLGPDAGAKVPNANAYIVNNAKLTLSGGVWKLTDKDGNTGVDFGDADLLFAYRPYDPNKTINSASGNDGRPSFVQASDGSWDINKGNNRFFVHPWDQNWETPTEADFANADWMGAAANITSETKTVTLNMTHMRGMVELTTDKNVKLAEMLVGFGKNAAGNKFVPYFANERDNSRTKNIYRILTTEYRNALTIYAKIEDDYIVKKYKLVIDKDAAYKKAGVRYLVNIDYTPEEIITVGNGTSLEDIVTNMGTAPTTLRLKGTLSDADWTFLKGLALTSLDMYQLTNTEIPSSWMGIADETAPTTLGTNLTTLVLPNGLKTINYCGLKFPNTKTISIELPASVTTLNQNAFWHSNNLSLRIPDESQLVTIGPSALDGLKAVYTDAGNPSVLKIPASVTTIDGSAFWGVTDLKKIIFQSETAPTIGTNAFANVSAHIVVPNKTNYYGKSYFPSKTVFVGPALTANNYKTDYTYIDGYDDNKGIPALCDGPANTLWHSDYGYLRSYDDWGIFIDITLPKAYSNLKLSYTSRYNSTSQLPKAVRIGVSADGNTFTETNVYAADALATAANEPKELAISASSSYTKVRFGVIKTAGGHTGYGETVGDDGFFVSQNATNINVFTSLSELTVYEEKWTE